MSYALTFQSRLPLTMRGQLETMLFFNEGQHRVRHAIEATIERYGLPEVVEINGALSLQIAKCPDVQILFAVQSADGGARPVGVVVYVRDSIERLTVLHLCVADDHATGGRFSSQHVLQRLLHQIRWVARRTQGVEHMALAYRGSQLRLAQA
jgi:hypothetical protein